jgi:SAM-dependent methyltransferase
MLDLIRLSPRPIYPPGGIDLYRQIALLTAMGENSEVLSVGCGKALPLEYWAEEFAIHASGVEPDGALVQAVIERARRRSLADRLQVQQAPTDALPYRDGIFDVVIGEVGMTARAAADAAVGELVRVARPGGFVVLVQLVWTAAVDGERRRVLEEHLGVRPHMLVEWKRLLRENGIEDLHTEDWTDPSTAFRAQTPKPFPDFAELFSVPEKLAILRRAWALWGWTGVRSVLVRERAIHRLLTRERWLGLYLIKGRKAPMAGHGAVSQAAGSVAGHEPEPPPSADEPSHDEAIGLPLFEDRP